MEHIAALHLIVGRNEDVSACERAAGPLAQFSSIEECVDRAFLSGHAGRNPNLDFIRLSDTLSLMGGALSHPL